MQTENEVKGHVYELTQSLQDIIPEIDTVLLSEGFTKIPNTECGYEKKSDITERDFMVRVSNIGVSKYMTVTFYEFGSSIIALSHYKIISASEIIDILNRLAEYTLYFMKFIHNSERNTI